VKEVRELGKRLGSIGFSHVFTSPLRRALQTCASAGLKGVQEIEPDLAEWDYGDYDGKCSVDIRKSRPDWNLFRDGCPNGEMPAQAYRRAGRLFKRLRMLDGKIVLFTHGQFGSVLAARWIGLPVVRARHFTLGTASLSILAFNPDHPEVPVISLWNAGPHEISLSAE
jgi:probable phosphoglycerate mutase